MKKLLTKSSVIIIELHVNDVRYLGRPEPRSGRAYILPVMFFSPRFLRDPSTDRPETLPHDQNLPPANHRCAVGLLHSELQRRAASRRALPCTSSFCLWTKVHHIAWKSLVRIFSLAPKLSGLRRCILSQILNFHD